MTVARVLLIAPTCDGEDVGEAWVAFQWASLLQTRHVLTVLTYHKRGRTPLSAQLPATRVVEWREPMLLGRFERLNSMLKPAYVPFYLMARRWIRNALRAGEHFDVIHQPVPVAMRYPSPGVGFGIPLVIGPVGGGLEDPPGFASVDTDPWFVRLRRLDALRLRHDPLLRRTYSAADCVLGIAPYVSRHLEAVPLRRFEVMSETGLIELPPEVRRHESATLRLVFVGRVIRTKGARYAIEALDQLRDLDVRLDIVGEGPDRAYCERRVADLGLADRVVWHGWVASNRVSDYYAAADLFVFPSYREPGGNAVWEALGHGLPAIVCDRGGPAATVDDTCGIRLPVTSERQLVEDIAVAVRRLSADPVQRRELGRGALRRAHDAGLWSAKLRQMDAILGEVAGLDS